MIGTLVLSLLCASHAAAAVERLAPWFVVEAPPVVQYGVGEGVRVTCVARGDPPPAVAWLAEDGSALEDVPGLRRVYGNGTLELAGGAAPRPATLRPATLRCRAANAHGVALSRETTLRPVGALGAVGAASWEAVLWVRGAAAGGVAALTCGASRDPQLVEPAAWYRGEEILHVDPPTPESRYVVAGSSLLIRAVSPADAGPYSCLARHSLSSVTRRSQPAMLTVTASAVGAAPGLVSASELTARAGSALCLPCAAADHPPPTYSWYREVAGRLQPVESSPEAWWWAGGAALCLPRARPQHAGAWLCKAYNVFGDATAQLRIHVTDTLTVTVGPSVLVAETGSTVRLNCSASDPAARLAWLHDGAAAGAGAALLLRSVSRSHRGLYQCFARRPHDSAHADLELRLGDSAPELHYTFIEQALRPGGSVSLRCAASGSPAPRISWLLDGQPLDQFGNQHRYFISEESSAGGDVASALNVSAATAAAGGRYSCRAHNRLGRAEHSARLNIYGPPSIRALGPVRVVAGDNVTLYCPYAGYPISSVTWWVRGSGTAVGGTGRVSARGAALRLSPALPSDAGHYACAVAAPSGPAARRDIEIQVRNPPKISPFMFSSELTEGSSVQVLCGVSSGDKPMYFSWFKDGAPLPSNLQIEEKSLNEFSLLMFSELTSRHSGAYTCRVSNHAASVNYTATLSVKVTPSWVKEPQEAAVLLGAPLLIECAAKGYPTPDIVWFRKIGDGISLGESTEQWEQVRTVEWSSSPELGLQANNGTLSAGTAARAHQGLYRCQADNGVGPPLVKHLNITVHEAAQLEGPGGNVSCVRGQSATLTCDASGDAPLSVHWSHRGAKLDLNSFRWSVSEARTAGGLKSSLQLRAAEKLDAGEYRCHARNQFGSSELLMYLHVEEPPAAPRSVRLCALGSRWARVCWRAAPALHHAALTAPRADTAPEPHQPQTLLNLTVETTDDRADATGSRAYAARLADLRPAVPYTVHLVASNHVGQSPQSDPLLFTTLDEAPSAAPLMVRVRPAGPGELHVSWSAPSPVSWNGQLIGHVVSWREVGGSSEGRMAARGWSAAALTVVALRSGARYAVTVRSYNRAGAGPHSPVVHGATPAGAPEESPQSVSCIGVSPRALRVRWAPVPHAAPLLGYDLHLATIQQKHSWSVAEWQVVRAGGGGEARVVGLRAATNYSVWVRARSDLGLGPPAPPVYCSTLDDVAGAVGAVRAVAAGGDTVRASWLPPAGPVTHYTLYTRELGKVGGEWSQRVEAEEGEEEMWRDVRGLRARAVYELWVRAATPAGVGPPSVTVTAAPIATAPARISSLSRAVSVVEGADARLRCAAVGEPPLRRRWSPLPPRHVVSDAGDLIIHGVDASLSGNYTCRVRNAAGSDAVSYVVRVRRPPSAPLLRLARADLYALHLTWEHPVPDPDLPLISYSIWWSLSEEPAETAETTQWASVPASDSSYTARGLRCGAAYSVRLRAHSAAGASPPSRPLLARTAGDSSYAVNADNKSLK
ncbi:Down syndrome cell adhesion molecule-like protein Dscam2 [Bombyx mandarina]|uniref:Down syndrome cell adhesion molecule-like protein Dscam2 n=1 Tax=Bombyx mandarina TaxID=7092 RepID=A0A6J2KDT4_BOMMA|nr:Down syndrome cell adhesion molecule-like protein Dscam2 [Bombyx mandarina]